MAKHDHHQHCDHALSFCEKCDVPYCTKCNKEWAEPCSLNHYYWSWGQPYAGTTTISSGDSGDISVSSVSVLHADCMTVSSEQGA